MATALCSPGGTARLEHDPAVLATMKEWLGDGDQLEQAVLAYFFAQEDSADYSAALASRAGMDREELGALCDALERATRRAHEFLGIDEAVDAWGVRVQAQAAAHWAEVIEDPAESARPDDARHTFRRVRALGVLMDDMYRPNGHLDRLVESGRNEMRALGIVSARSASAPSRGRGRREARPPSRRSTRRSSRTSSSRGSPDDDPGEPGSSRRRPARIGGWR
jgi:hypothetical protein